MVNQKSQQLLKDIQEVGCLYLCLARMVEELFNVEFTYNQINSIWELAIKHGKIVNRDMKDPDGVLKMLKEIQNIDDDRRIMQIGQTINGYTQYWGWVKDKYKEKVFTMAMEKTGGKYETHFILVKSYKEPIITYDSWTLPRAGETTNAQRFIYYGVI